MKEFSPQWKSSKKPRKQRKYLANAPLHIRKDFLKVQLSKPLRVQYKRRNVLIRSGDKVKIMRGQFYGIIGKVEEVNYTTSRVFVEGASIVKKDGSKSSYPIHPSNLQVQEMVLNDKRRIKSIERTVNKK